MKIKWIVDPIDMIRKDLGLEHTKYKTCRSRMIIVCIKQHLSKIWSSIHSNAKGHWSLLEKKCMLCITVAI